MKGISYNSSEKISFLDKKIKDLNMKVKRPDFDGKYAKDLIFMQIDADCDSYNSLVVGESQELDGHPLIRFYGITEDKISVCLMIKGFYPYFYVKKPIGLIMSDQKQINQFKNRMFEYLKSKNAKNKGVLSVEEVEKTDIYGYHAKAEKFLKITLVEPKSVSTLRELFEGNHDFFQNLNLRFEPKTYESKVSFALRFMIDRGIPGMSWIKIEKGKFKIINANKISTCQIDAITDVENVIPLSTNSSEFSKVAPLRILSIDIECSSEKGHFPNHQIDPIIQISNICVEFGVNNNEPFVQKMFSLKKCADIAGVDVRSYEEEKDLLKEWSLFVTELDPDIITGYNINNFDLPYLLNRAEILKVKEMERISRIKSNVCKVKHRETKVKGFMNRDTIDLNLDGRIVLDMYTCLIREQKLRSYTLNNVSLQILGEQKEDVHHSMISVLWKKNEFTRRRLAVYCMKDAYLPLKLIDNLMTIFNYTEMCRVTSTPLNFILTRGQQIKVSTQLHVKAKEHNYIIPCVRSFKGAGDDDEGFEGAFVLSPVTGYHSVPIVTLDFSSLYPSIMIAHNLCYTTLLKNGEEKSLGLKEGIDFIRTPNGECFVTEKVRKGLIPTILEELLAARKRAKKDMNEETDPFKKKVYNGRQLALKISCNSVYGFTGATVGALPCLQISSSVTSIGRTMIEKTRDLVQEKYSIKNGFKYNSQVIYGDTDSVMIKFGIETLHEAMVLGNEASEYVTSHFKKPIKIEFEKVFFPYLLLKKKKYAGVMYTREDKYDKIDAKGLEAVRRDNCELVRLVVETVIKKLLIDRDIEGSVNFVKGVVADLLQNRIDIGLLIISKTLTKKSDEEEDDESDEEENKKKSSSSIRRETKDDANTKKRQQGGTYLAKQAHVELADKMKKRDPGNAPNIGDRIQYVIIQGDKSSKTYERSEDPLYALEHELPLDIDYYLENQLKKPLLRIFEPILQNAENTLFSGEHTKIRKTGGVAKSNIFGNFIVIKKTCLKCKTSIESGPLCRNCKEELKEVYIKNKLELNYLEKNYCDLWTECQRCQGLVMQDIICQNKDCPIFYRRYKVRKDMIKQDSIMKRFYEKLEWN